MISTDRIRKAKRWRYQRMLLHVWAGHPIAALLASIGFLGAARRWHYFTEPPHIKRRFSREQIRFDYAGRESFFIDMFWWPWSNTLRAMGLYDAAERIVDQHRTPACDRIGFFAFGSPKHWARVRTMDAEHDARV